MAPPILNQHLSFGQRAEDLAVEQFIPHFTIETLDVAVLPGAAFLDEQRSDVQARQPVADALSSELRAVVRTDISGSPPRAEQPGQLLEHLTVRQMSFHAHSKAFACVF